MTHREERIPSSERYYLSVSCSQYFLSLKRNVYEHISTSLNTSNAPDGRHTDGTDGIILPAENNHHFAYKRYPCSFIPHEAFWVKENPKPLVGGFNELSFVVDSVRRVKSATLLLDAGDVMTGNPITEYTYAGAEGGALFEMMNRIGYDLWTPGNNDFDISSANLRKLTVIAKFPTVSANILDTLNHFPVNNKEYVVIEKNGLKIGVIGIMSDDFYIL